MSKRIEVGKLCEKGHASWEGETDHGTCASHYYATIYLTIEDEWVPRDRPRIPIESVAASLSLMAKDAENHAWCGADEEDQGSLLPDSTLGMINNF